MDFVEVDPGNNLNTNGGKHQAVIYGSRRFDASLVDQDSVRVGAAAPVRVKAGDVNGDGYPDVTVQVESKATGLQPGDRGACVTGVSVSGVSFKGCGSVTVQ